MASIKMILDKRKVKPNGSYPICFLICHNRKTTTRSAKVYVLEKDCDDETKSIKKSNSLHKTLNLKLKKEIEYQIVSESEANLKEGKISVKSPIAASLIGKSVGAIVDVQTPGGIITFEILEINI